LLLEAAFNAGRKEVLVLIHPDPEAQDEGLIAAVRFHHGGADDHVQETMSGQGQRRVRRVDESLRVQFDEGTFSFSQEVLCQFRHMAWVSVDPVSGVLQPYTSDNASKIEERYHLRENSAHVSVPLPNGVVLHVTISFDFQDGQHTQSTGTGLRSVSRLILESVPPDGYNIPFYRRPFDESIDSGRYRLVAVEGGVALAEQGNLNVPASAFMAEATLSADVFSPIKSWEAAIGQLGIPPQVLRDVSARMKDEPMRLAGVACMSKYQADSEVALMTIIDSVIETWETSALTRKPYPDMYLTGGGHALGHEVRGMYKAVDMLNGKPVYRMETHGSPAAGGTIFFADCWKISPNLSTDTWSWSAGGPAAEADPLPPQEGWVQAEGGAAEAAPAEAAPAVGGEDGEESSNPQIRYLGAASQVDVTNPEFARTVASLFSNTGDDAADKEFFSNLTCTRRGGRKMLDMRRVAAAGLWRVLTAGAGAPQ
jgi:hypothetical protein